MLLPVRNVVCAAVVAVALFSSGQTAAQPCPEERVETGPAGLSFSPIVQDDGGVEFIYHVPADSERLILLFHGGGGSASSWFSRAERVRFLQTAVDAGYAVAALDSDDRVEKKWSTILDDTNPDLINLEARLAELELAGSLTANARVFAVGMSNGGGFVSRLSQLMDLAAMTISHARGIAGVFNFGAPPPTLWIAGPNDGVVPLSELDANLATAASRGLRHELYVNEPRPVTSESMTRIAGVDGALADSIHAALQGAGLLDGCGLQTTDPDLSSWESVMPPAAAGFENEIRAQLKELHGTHTFTSDFSSEVIAFFRKLSGPLPARLHVVKPAKLAKLISKSRTIAPEAFDIPVAEGEADPTLYGAQLVFADLGSAAGSVSFTLDASGWSGLGNPAGAKGYKYKGRDDVTDPEPKGTCSVVLIKEKVIKAICKREAVTLSPPYAGAGSVHLGIPTTSGSAMEYCWELGGDERKNDDRILKRKDAPAPPGCP